MVGALDLGGASAQITFVPQSTEPAPYTSTRYLFGKEFHVYSYSHLCYGKSVSQQRVWAEVINQQSSVSLRVFFSILVALSNTKSRIKSALIDLG